MANRSDFFNTSAKTPKLPRYLKKVLALNYTDAHHNGEVRRLFIQAHQAHVAHKLKRGNDDTVDTGVEE